IDGEFTKDYQTDRYLIDVAPGDKLNIKLEPIGDTLQTGIVVIGPTGLLVGHTGNSISYGNGLTSTLELLNTPSMTTPVLSARGKYTIAVINAAQIDNKDT